MSSLTPPPLNLPRLCTTHLILALFSLPDIKCQLKWLLLSQNRRDYEKKSSALLQRLQKKLILLHLPLPLYNNLLFSLDSMTQKLLLYLKPIAWSLQKASLTPGTNSLLPAPANRLITSSHPPPAPRNRIIPPGTTFHPFPAPATRLITSSHPPPAPPNHLITSSHPLRLPLLPSNTTPHPTPLEIHIENFINNLQWTQDGTINSSRTFEILHNLKKLPQTPAMYSELFNLCLENCINDVWSLSPSPEGLKQFINGLNDDLSIHKNEIIPAYFVYKYYNKMDELLHVVQRLLENKVYQREKGYHRCCHHVSIEENMFRFAVYNGNFAGVKYFWRKLNDEEKGRSLLRMLEASLMQSGSKNGWIAPLRVQEYDEQSEISIYLLSQIDECDLEDLFSPLEKKRDFLMVLGAFVNFPWQESFIWNIERNFHHLDAESFNFVTAGTLYKSWKHHETFGVTILENKYFGFFRRIWEKSSIDLRKSYKVNYWRIFFLLGKLKEFEVVKEIYREEGLKGRMRGALDEGERWFRVFYKRDSLEFWWWFEEEVLTGEGERRRFRGMICEVLMEREKDELWQEYKERGENKEGKERGEGKGKKREIKFRK